MMAIIKIYKTKNQNNSNIYKMTTYFKYLISASKVSVVGPLLNSSSL